MWPASSLLRVVIQDRGVWILRHLLLSALVGSGCAFFLWSLDVVTAWRMAHPWAPGGLPVLGLGVGLLYHRYGRTAERGTHLLLDEIHQPGGGVPRRMAPLVLLGTLATHLGGGSAGREGTAVQMGGSLAGTLQHALKVPAPERAPFLRAGVAAGFGAVFGTPLAGTVFALEVLAWRHLRVRTVLACLVSALGADLACRGWGIHHTDYLLAPLNLQPGGAMLRLLGEVALGGVAFGLASRLFVMLSHGLTVGWRRLLPWAPLRPVAGGVAVVVFFLLAGRADFLGLGVWSTDPQALTIPRLLRACAGDPMAWLWKLLFTAVTLSSGFKGGEVTPLFFIGAALGQTVGQGLGTPPGLLAPMGFAAVFAAATRTPFASTLMGVELFGPSYTVPLVVACLVAYACSGARGIYGKR